MKTRTLLLVLCSLLTTLPLRAQTDVPLEPEVGGRLTLELDKKLAKGLHLSLEEELRFDENFGSFDRFHSTVSLKYKIHPNIKLGLGYALITPYSVVKSSFKEPRHRLMADATWTLKYGNWNFSLRERLQWTHRTGDMNTYQEPRNVLGLKSRLMAKYKGLGAWEPYASVEMRHFLNAHAVSANYNTLTGIYYNDDGLATGEAGWFLNGTSAYMNRLRGTLGVDYRVNRSNSLNFSFMGDYVSDKVIDANAAGTKLKSYTVETGFIGWFCAGYTYSF
ncbi:MAG: DUF2490 domain-containing protein [Bacteroidales bacterium]|nr:DUF2490 domain-containing protein [Bacteroidales bacterium]